MARLRLATVWLGGCSGCHMSFLDLDEWLIDLAGRADLVYSPLVDVKEYPEGVDVVLVEGRWPTRTTWSMIQPGARSARKVLVSFGDCAVTGNVTALRNPLGSALAVLRPVYLEQADLNPASPTTGTSCRCCWTACSRSTRWCRSISTCRAARRRAEPHPRGAGEASSDGDRHRNSTRTQRRFG